MISIDAFEYVFPITGGKEKSYTEFRVKNVYGTCFSLSNSIFLSAGHVVNEIEAEKLSLSIGIRVNHHFRHFPIEDYDVFDDLDLAIIRSSKELPYTKQFKWNLKKLNMLDGIATVGFPHAIDFQEYKLSISSFKGYIISENVFSRLKAKPRAYEFSFIAPSGLSGAPLLFGKDFPAVNGYIIGNSKIQIPILSDIETTKEDDTTTIVEHYEMSTFGIAIQCESIINVESKLLSGSIKKFLEKNNLILDT